MRRLWLSMVAAGLTATALYAGSVLYRSFAFYAQVKAKATMASPGVFASDPQLGFAPRSDAQGTMYMPEAPDVPVRYDADRFRVPADDRSWRRGAPVVLALGCSFTHGDGVLAEQAFPYQLGVQLGGSERNAGFAAYGLAQIFLQARLLIPSLRPAVVVVEYAPWLVTRALSQFAPTGVEHRPQPYFGTRDGALSLQPPLFPAQGFGLDAASFRDSPRGLVDFGAFAARVAVPLFVRDDLAWALFRVRQATGRVAPPASDRPAVVGLVYEEIAALCEANGCRVVVLVLGAPWEAPAAAELQRLKDVKGVTLVDGSDYLMRRLPTPDAEVFLQTYAHVGGEPPHLIDPHPNATAHRLLAEAVAEALRR